MRRAPRAVTGCPQTDRVRAEHAKQSLTAVGVGCSTWILIMSPLGDGPSLSQCCPDEVGRSRIAQVGGSFSRVWARRPPSGLELRPIPKETCHAILKRAALILLRRRFACQDSVRLHPRLAGRRPAACQSRYRPVQRAGVARKRNGREPFLPRRKAQHSRRTPGHQPHAGAEVRCEGQRRQEAASPTGIARRGDRKQKRSRKPE